MKLYAPEGPADGCASGACLPDEAPKAAPPPSSEPADLRWKRAVEAVRAASPRYGKSLGFGRLMALTATEVKLGFTADAAFHRATVTGTARANIEKLLSEKLGGPIRIAIEMNEAAIAAAPKSVAEEEALGRTVRERSIEDKVRSHPAVQATMRLLGGELEHVQVLEKEAGGPDAEPPDERS